MKARLASLPGECVLAFDRYDNESPNDHERMWRAGVGYTNYSIAINNPLPSAVTIDTHDTVMFGHEEAEVTIISYVMQAVGEGKNVVRVLCDDTDVFVLLVFWMWRYHMQMERWDGAEVNINQTCTKLGSKCLQLLEMFALTGCDTTSFPFNKGKESALSVIEAGDFPGLFHVLGEEDAMQWGLLEVELSLFCALYDQKPGTPMEEAMYNLYTKTKAMPRLRNLPPNSTNLILHVQRAHP